MKPLHRLLSVQLAGWAVGGALAHAAFGAVSTVILARVLNPAGLGAYGIFLAVAFLLTQLGDMGLGTAHVRVATPVFMRGADIRQIYQGFLGARMLLVLALGVAGGWFSGLLRDPAGNVQFDVGALFAAGLGGGLLLTLAGHHYEILRARLRHRDSAGVRTGVAAMRAAAYAGLALGNTLTLRSAIGVALVTMALECVALAPFALRGVRLWPPVRPRPERDWFVVSAWLFVTSGAGALMTQTDTFLVGWLGTPAQTGWWVAGTRLIGVFPMVVGALWSVVLPVSVALGERAKLERYLRMAWRTTLVVVLASFAGALLVPHIVILAFGSAYQGATGPAQWLLVAHGVNVAAILNGGLLLRLRLERELAAVSLVQLAINALGDVLLIPRYGATGCAAVTTVALSIGSAWSVWRVHQARATLLATATAP